MKINHLSKLAIATVITITLSGCGDTSSSSSNASSIKITASLSPQKITSDSNSTLHVVATNITDTQCMNPKLNFGNDKVASWDKGNIDESYSGQTCTSNFTIDGNQSGTTDIVVLYGKNKSAAQKLTVSDLSIHTNDPATLTNGIAPATKKLSAETICDQKDVRGDTPCKTIYVDYKGDTPPQLKMSNNAKDFKIQESGSCLSTINGYATKIFNCKKYQLSYLPKDKSEIGMPIATKLVATEGNDTKSLEIKAQIPTRIFYKKQQNNYFFDYIDRLDSATTPFAITSTAPDGYEFNNAAPTDISIHAGSAKKTYYPHDKSIDINQSWNHFGNYFSPANDNNDSYFAESIHQPVQSIQYTSSADITAYDNGVRYTPYKIMLTRDFIAVTDQGNVYTLAAMSNKPNTESLKNLANNIPGSNLNPVAKKGKIYDLSIDNNGIYSGKSTEYKGYVMYKDTNNILNLPKNFYNIASVGSTYTLGSKYTTIIDSSKVDDTMFHHYNLYLTKESDSQAYSLYWYYPAKSNLRGLVKFKIDKQIQNPELAVLNYTLRSDEVDMAIYNSDGNIDFYNLETQQMKATHISSLKNIYKQQPVKFSWHRYHSTHLNQGEMPVTKVFMLGVAKNNDLTFIDPSETKKVFSIPAKDFSDSNSLENFIPKTFSCADEDMNDYDGYTKDNSIAPICYMSGWDSSAKKTKVYRISGFNPNKLAQIATMPIKVSSTHIENRANDITAPYKEIIDGDTGSLLVLPTYNSDHLYHYQLNDDTPNSPSIKYNGAVIINPLKNGEKFTGLYIH